MEHAFAIAAWLFQQTLDMKIYSFRNHHRNPYKLREQAVTQTASNYMSFKLIVNPVK